MSTLGVYPQQIPLIPPVYEAQQTIDDMEISEDVYAYPLLPIEKAESSWGASGSVSTLNGSDSTLNETIQTIVKMKVWGGPVARNFAWHHGPRDIRIVWGDGFPFSPVSHVAGICEENVHLFNKLLKNRYKFVDSLKNSEIYVCLDAHESKCRVEGACWQPNDQWVYFGKNGAQLKPYALANAIDIVAHELGHRVIQLHGGTPGCLAYERQSGALNESLADIIGITTKHFASKSHLHDIDWSIGKGIYLDKDDLALRSFENPNGDSTIKVERWQPKNANGYKAYPLAKDNGGVHTNSGIPNHAFYKVVTKLGCHSWKRPTEIWLNALKSCKADETFASFAQLTHEGCLNTHEKNAVEKAWSEVGIIRGQETIQHV